MEEETDRYIQRMIDSKLKEPLVKQHQRALKLREAFGVGIIKPKLDLHGRWWVYQATHLSSTNTGCIGAGGEVIAYQHNGLKLVAVIVSFPCESFQDVRKVELDAEEFKMLFDVIEPAPLDPDEFHDL